MVSAEPEKAKHSIQEQFTSLRTHGDWFRPADELVLFIRSNAQRPLTPPAVNVPTDAMLSIEDVARLFNVSVPTVRRMVSDGRLPCVRVGRQLRFSPNDIKNLLGRPK